MKALGRNPLNTSVGGSNQRALVKWRKSPPPSRERRRSTLLLSECSAVGFDTTVNRYGRSYNDRRLVVLIDDLDRCDPKLIPHLLLSLRELLDLPGFTFLLAFDDEIVGRALTQENPAWAEGANFLEKILDFRFHLPPVTEQQKERLIDRALVKYCSFVPNESARKIQDLSPNNPRKLKALVRSLAAVGPRLKRHDPDELNWVDMWLAQMLRLESYPFFEHLLKGETLDKETGLSFQILKGERKGEERNESLRKLIKAARVEDDATSNRLVHLVEAIRSRSSSSFRYACELAIRPPAVTWKEFRLFHTKWKADPQTSTLLSWIDQHAKGRDVPTSDVENELFQAMIDRRAACLSGAAESASIQDHDLFVAEAESLLALVKQDLIGITKLDKARFEKVFGQASYWIDFRKNPTDMTLRKAEEAFLLELVSSASEVLCPDFFGVVGPQHWTDDLLDASKERAATSRHHLPRNSSQEKRETLLASEPAQSGSAADREHLPRTAPQLRLKPLNDSTKRGNALAAFPFRSAFQRGRCRF